MRSAHPEGISPQEEWHGPYEVVLDPQTGGYFVVDNADRAATVLPLRGFATVEQAQRSRDYIDGRRASRERAKALADSIFGGAMEILDPGGTPESRHSEAVLADADRLLHLYGDANLIAFDESGDPYVRVDATDGSGWFVVDYGFTHLLVRHVADPDTSQDQIEIDGSTPSSFFTTGTRPDGWTREHAVAELATWIAEVGDDYARNIPVIIAWKRRGSS